MGIVKEFKDFIMRGNVVDLAVAVIIGAAFSAIVDSMVKDVLMPPLGLAMGGLDFNDKKVELKAKVPAGTDEQGNATKEIPAVELRYGAFITAAVKFLIVAFCIFLLVKGINTLKRMVEKPAGPPPTPEDIQLLREIRDSLKHEYAKK